MIAKGDDYPHQAENLATLIRLLDNGSSVPQGVVKGAAEESTAHLQELSKGLAHIGDQPEYKHSALELATNLTNGEEIGAAIMRAMKLNYMKIEDPRGVCSDSAKEGPSGAVYNIPGPHKQWVTGDTWYMGAGIVSKGQEYSVYFAIVELSRNPAKSSAVSVASVCMLIQKDGEFSGFYDMINFETHSRDMIRAAGAAREMIKANNLGAYGNGTLLQSFFKELDRKKIHYSPAA